VNSQVVRELAQERLTQKRTLCLEHSLTAKTLRLADRKDLNFVLAPSWDSSPNYPVGRTHPPFPDYSQSCQDPPLAAVPRGVWREWKGHPESTYPPQPHPHPLIVSPLAAVPRGKGEWSGGE